MDPRADSAAFEPTKIARRRGGGPLAIGLFALVIGGLVAVGSFDRLTGRTAPPAVVPGSSAALDGVAAAQESAQPPAPARPEEAQRPETVRLDVRLDGYHLFIHGTLVVQNVASIALSLVDGTGRVAERATVSVPGGSTAFRLAPETRFDSYMRIPDDLVGEPTWIEAIAYTATGARVATARDAVAGQPPSVVDDAGLIDLRVRTRTAGSKDTTRQLVRVDGRVLVRAQNVTIQLETHDEVLVHVTRDVSNRDGGIRPMFFPTFEAEFDLTALGLAGPLWVAVTAYDRDGALVARIRRAVSTS